MNIAMISGLLAAASGGTPLNGLINPGTPTTGTDFSALLSSIGKDKGLLESDISAELQLLFAGERGTLPALANLPAEARDAAAQKIAALLFGARESATMPGAVGSDSAEISSATLNTQITEDTDDPSVATGERVTDASIEALLAAMAQGFAGQSAPPTPPFASGPKPTRGITETGTESLVRDNPLPLNTLLSPPLAQAPAPAAAAKDITSMIGHAAAGTGEAPVNRSLFQVDRSGQQIPASNPRFAETLSATSSGGKGSEASASSIADAANNAASPLHAASHSAPGQVHRVSESAPSLIATPLNDRINWHHDFGDRIVWMAKQDQQSADIRITPTNLGPVQISLNIEDGKASAIFASPHAEVRQAIEEALPRLREMLNAAGINLDQANVGSQMPQQQSDGANRFAAAPRNWGENAILPGDEGNRPQAIAMPVQRGRGLVDLFA
mgnify:CR=1 FL=1